MADHITLPRVTVEQALSLCESVQGLHTDDEDGSTVWCQELIDALRAALAQQAEPVQPAAGVDAYDMIDRFLRNNLRDDDYAEYSAALDSLYIAPQPVQRKPLTEEEIDELSRTMVKGDKSVNWLCRAIEQAHGIKEAK